MKETAKSSGSEAGRVGDPLKSGPLLASDSGTNFELEDGEWDIGIGDLIIDLDADIEKTNSAIVGGTGIGVMFGSQMATASSAKSPKAAGSVPIPIQSSSPANQSSVAAANSGLKMKFKRTKPSPGTRGTEGKLEIVKNADPSHSGILQQPGVDKNRLQPLKKPTTPLATPLNKKEKGKDSPVKTEGRPLFPINPPIVKVAPTVQQCSARMPNSVNATKPVVPVAPTPNCAVSAPVEQKVVAVSQEVSNSNELDESQSLVKRPKLKRLPSDQAGQPKSPTNESVINQSEVPPVLLQKTDICVGTSVGTMTEPECLGPCEPGTAVTLEGIVWHESEGGVLVVNVTWRGKTYVGTLMDCTRHQWAPPRFCESPQEDLDTRGKPRPKRLRGNGPSTPQEQANSSLYTKLRTTVKGRVTRTATNSGSPLKSEQNGTKRKGTKDIEANNNANKRSRSNSRGPDTASPSVTAETAPPVSTSPLLLECPVPSCSKKYKHANGLKFHQDHAHNGDEVEQAKCDSEVESVLDSASRRSTPVISDRKETEAPAETSESEKTLEMNVEIGADSKTIMPQLPILAAALEENKTSRAASGSPASKVPSDPSASGTSPAVLSTTVVPAIPVLVGEQEQDALQEEENELLENKQVPEKPPEVLGPSEPPVLAAGTQQPSLSEDGTREDVKSPAYSDISDPNDQAPSIDPEFMETVNKFEEPTEPIRNFGMYSVFNHQTPFLVENSKPEPSAPKPDAWGQERKAELVKEIPKEDSFVSVTNAQYFQPLFIPPEFPSRGIGQQSNESGQYATDKRPHVTSGDLKLQSEVSKDLSLKDVGIPLSLGPPLPNPLTHVQNIVKHKTEKEDRREISAVIHDFRTEGPPRVAEPIPLESIKHHEDKKKSHPSKSEGFPEYHHDKNGKLPKPSGSNSLHRSTMSPSASGLHRSTISPNPKHVSKHQSMDRRDEERDKDSEDKHEHKTSHHYEGVKPTMETQGPPPPTGQPTSLNYPYLFPQYHLPFDTFRSPGPLLLPSHFAPSGSLHSPSFMHPGHPNMQHMNPSPNHLRFPSIHMMNHSQEELARVQHSMDFLQHHAQHQFYPMNPPHSQGSINLSNSHKIHELSERAMKSPNTSNSVPKEAPSYHSQSPSDRVMPPSSLPQSAKPQMPPPGSSPFMMGGGLGFPPHQFVPTSMSGAPSPFTPGKPIFRP